MVTIHKLVATILLVASIFMTGCSVKEPIYRWGSYESLLYQMYAEEGGEDPSVQLSRLAEDVERTQAEGKRVPPGVHAHLGYLYYGQGNIGSAKRHFLAEKELFPESSVFVDGILKRLSRKR